MANVSQSSTHQFVGIEAGKLIARQMVKGSSLAQGIFQIRQNAKGKTTLRTIQVGTDALQGSLCDFTPAGGDINNKTVDLSPVNINLQFCKDELNIEWSAYDMQPGADGSLNAEAATAITEAILHRVAIAVDKDIWSAITAEAVADTDIPTQNKVTLAGVLTVDNILDEIGKVYSALAQVEDFDPSDAVIIMHTTDKAVYEQALAKNGAMPQFYLDEKGTNYLGVKIAGIVGANPGYVYGSFVSNLYYLTDIDNDRNNVTLKDMGDTDLSNNIRFKAHWWNTASYAFPERFVLGTKTP
jgi:hypothetical protein